MSRKAESGIYAITHLASGKVYVGSAVNIRRRWNGHRSQLGSGKHHCRYLQAAWNKYGPDAFAFSVLELVAVAADLLTRESAWITALHSSNPGKGYNQCLVAGSQLGRTHSAEARAKISAAWKGRPKTAAHQAAINAALKGRSLSAACREKLSAARSGTKASQAAREKMSAARRGMAVSEEARKKIGDKVRQRHAIARAHGLDLKGYAALLRQQEGGA